MLQAIVLVNSFTLKFIIMLLEMNFEVSKLEVLSLSRSATDDEALYAISKSCCRLLHLDLKNCYDVTEKGVRQMVEKCIKLREINLRDCLTMYSLRVRVSLETFVLTVCTLQLKCHVVPWNLITRGLDLMHIFNA